MEVIAEYKQKLLDIFEVRPNPGEDGPHAVKRVLEERCSVVAARIRLLPDGRYFAEVRCLTRIPERQEALPVACGGKLVLSYDKVCGAVVFREGDPRQYILIRNLSGHIGFPKGHCEDGEEEEETARREVREEIGIPVSLLPGFRCETHYTAKVDGEEMEKTGVYFLARIHREAVHIQEEEIPDWWTLPFEQALEKLNYESDRNILKRAQYYCITE